MFSAPRCTRFSPLLSLKILLALALTVGGSATVKAAPKAASAKAKISKTNKTPGLRSLDPNRSVEVFIQLSEPSVAAQLADAGGPTSMARDAQMLHVRKIEQQQSRVLRQIGKRARRVLSTLRVGANGFRIETLARNINALRAIEGVKSVAPVTRHTPDLATSVGWIGAPAVWEAFGDGEGVTIAILDTGIDYNHAGLGGSGVVADYENNDPFVVEPGSFPTTKVVAGRDFVGQFDVCSGGDGWQPEPDDDPLDFNGHGSHVSGIAAGLGVDGSIGPGVARGASLVAVKVFGDTAGCTNATADGIEYALDPNGDGVMDDAFDVINMSLGSSFGDPSDPTSIASQNAVLAGVIVVASAGNEGDVPYITGSPGTGRGVISVASSLQGGRTSLAIEIDSDDDTVAGRIVAVEGDGPVALADASRTAELVQTVSPPTDGDGNIVPGPPDGKACAPLDNAGALRGKIALVQRGDCFFLDKYLNVQRAGARALVVYNDGAADDRVEPIIMGGLSDEVSIVGVMISSTAGFALRDSIAAGNPAIATLDETITVPGNSVQDDTISGFSSRGPGASPGRRSRFKPDLTAPGDAIVSVSAGSGTEALTLGGTSMASPHVAGAAALMKLAFPNRGPLEIKTLLQNSTVTANIDGPGTETPYPLARQGVGVMRVDRAVELSSYAWPGGVTFSRINPVEDKKGSRPIRVVNLTDEDRRYTGTHVEAHGLPGVTIGCPVYVNVPANGIAEAVINIGVSVGLLPEDNSAFSQTEADGWCVLSDGVDTLRVGYLAVIDPASRLRATAPSTVRNAGPALGYGEAFTLAGDDGVADERGRHTIDAFGYRTAIVEGAPVVEFGLATDVPWNSLSHLAIQVFIDRDQDGTEDLVLFAGDWGLYLDGVLGTIITGQYALDSAGNIDFSDGFVDWTVSAADYNDRVVVLPYSNDPAGGSSFLEDGDTAFDYRLVVEGWDGATDTQTGTINLAAEIDVAEQSFSVPAGEQLELNASGVGELLLLYPGNRLLQQVNTLAVSAP